jgi:hypothetical protein
VWAGENLIAQMGVEHRVITNNGVPLRIFGAIDLCVAPFYGSRRIGQSPTTPTIRSGGWAAIDR